MTTTPAKLRAGAIGEWIPIPGADGPMLADSMDIADSCARADIECNTRPVDFNATPRYWDASTADVEDKEGIEQAVRYLEARGLIERHPEHQEWVRMREGA